jgi:hypothetical protein
LSKVWNRVKRRGKVVTDNNNKEKEKRKRKRRKGGADKPRENKNQSDFKIYDYSKTSK